MADEAVVVEYGRVVVAPDVELKELVELVGSFLPFFKGLRILETLGPELDKIFACGPVPCFLWIAGGLAGECPPR